MPVIPSTHPTPWRQALSAPELIIAADNVPAGQMDSPELAARVVEAVNAQQWSCVVCGFLGDVAAYHAHSCLEHDRLKKAATETEGLDLEKLTRGLRMFAVEAGENESYAAAQTMAESADLLMELQYRLTSAEAKRERLEGELATVRWDRECLQKRRDELESEVEVVRADLHRQLEPLAAFHEVWRSCIALADKPEALALLKHGLWLEKRLAVLEPAAKKWRATIPDMHPEYLRPEARELADALDSLAAEKESNG